MMTAKEKVLAGVAAIVVGYLVLGDYVLPYRLQPTTLLSASGTNAPSNGATFPQDTRAQATAFCIELITNRYNRVDEASRVFRRLRFVRRSIRYEQDKEQVFA